MPGDPDLDVRAPIYVQMRDDYRVWARPYYDGNFVVMVTRNGKTVWRETLKAKTNAGALSPGMDWVFAQVKKSSGKGVDSVSMAELKGECEDNGTCVRGSQ